MKEISEINKKINAGSGAAARAESRPLAPGLPGMAHKVGGLGLHSDLEAVREALERRAKAEGES